MLLQSVYQLISLMEPTQAFKLLVLLALTHPNTMSKAALIFDLYVKKAVHKLV